MVAELFLANRIMRCFMPQMNLERKFVTLSLHVFLSLSLVRCQAVNTICILGFPTLGPRQIIERKQFTRAEKLEVSSTITKHSLLFAKCY